MKRILLVGSIIALFGAIGVQSVSAEWFGCPWRNGTEESPFTICTRNLNTVAYWANDIVLTNVNLLKKTGATSFTAPTKYRAHTQCRHKVYGTIASITGPVRYPMVVSDANNNSITAACGPYWDFFRGRADIETDY